ncbi:DUF2017 family protein [Microbacterium sp. 2RAF4]|uniref:DUF2017 family protein n=1 Tax=Microbacterium sp. 2RAF4 TaxID=3232999 RepID=UPI003F985E78
MTSDRIIVTISAIEERHLAMLLDDLLELIGESRNGEDPAVDRLTPNPYPDDPEAAADFAGSTRKDLLDRRLADARRMRGALEDVSVPAAGLTDAEAARTRELSITLDDLESWLRTVTTLRLVIADRLGITTDEHTVYDSRHDVYDWLGYRLELLIQAADEAESGA